MRVSVIIKVLNEQRNIARAIGSALGAVAEAGGGEVIVADSLSTDDTIRIASGFPVRVVQLTHAEDRCCGVGAQLGFGIAKGQYLYILDGDMEFEPGFVAEAAGALDADPTLAGVGGLVREMNQENDEFVRRANRKVGHMGPGEVDRLDMGGLYRRTALEQVGYFTNQNLHAYEEFELAARLVTAGWRLRRLDRGGVRHYGHTDSSFALLRRRWRSRYAWGCGELIRQAWRTPQFTFILLRLPVYRIYGAMLVWAVLSLGVAAAAVVWQSVPLTVAFALLVVAPFAVMSWRRGSIRGGVYAVTSWLVFTAGMVAGALVTPRKKPRDPVRCEVLQ